MARSKSKYVVVARRRKWALSYPRALWDALTQDERQDVLARQAALIAEMDKANAQKAVL